LPLAPSDVESVHTPTLAAATRIAGHAPAKPPLLLNLWYVHHGRDEAFGVTAPSPATCNRAAAVSGNGAVIPAQYEAAANGKNVLKCIATISAQLQYAAIEADVRVYIGCFEIEVMPEC